MKNHKTVCKWILAVVSILLIFLILFAVYRRPQKISFPDSPAIQIHGNGKEIWIENKEQLDELTSKLTALTVKKELFSANTDFAENATLYADQHFYIEIYDASQMIHGMPNHMYTYAILTSDPASSRLILKTDGNGSRRRCTFANVEKDLPPIVAIVEDILADVPAVS